VTETPPTRSTSLLPSVLDALIWIAAFSFASGIFLSLTLLTRAVPPTPPVAVGRITIDHYAKARDYLNALLFFLVVPPVTIALTRLGRRLNFAIRRDTRRVAGGVDSGGLENLASCLFITPFYLAPFLYLTTFKWGWAVVIPIALSQALSRGLIALLGRKWLRSLLAPALRGWHALLFSEAFAWVLFRYIATGRRIAHIPTLFLEIVFIALMIAIYWLAALLVARLAAFCLGGPAEARLRGVAFAGLPLLGLPLLGVLLVDAHLASGVAFGLMLLVFFYALRVAPTTNGSTIRRIVAWLILPMLLYVASYASTASLSQWIDLFHRGESLGPASDYLQGKVPYRDVFVLHGLMEDGMLDAWLMGLFGRNLNVALVRPVLLGSCAVPALWFLAMSLFDSIPLAFAAVGLGAVTTVDNERTFFELAVVTLLVVSMRTGKKWLLCLAGIAAGVAVFFSLDIGLYSIAGAGGYLLIEMLLARRVQPASGRGLAGPMIFAAGAAAGMLPFVLFLILHGAFADFLETSFRIVPQIIDAVWSMPYPDLTAAFHRDLTLHTISDFFLFEPFRFVLNPLVIAIALTWLIRRFTRRSFGPLEHGLLAITLFALVTQRSALGRADFRHQYFSAFLIGPMILILIVVIARASREVWTREGANAQAFLVLAAVASMPLLVVALWIPDVLNVRLDDTIHYRGRLAGSIHEPAAEMVADRIRAVTGAIEDMTHATDTIFDFSNQPALYFFAHRMNPTRFYQIPIASPVAFQRETILALDRFKPKVVIRKSPEGFDTFDGIDNRLRAPALAAYLEDHYSYATTVRGIELWQRENAPGALNLVRYLSLVHIPTAKEADDAARDRLIIPSIGSAAGIDSYWRSDLVIHNPFRVPMTLRLRYVSAAKKVEKRVRLGGGQIIRWDDVVSSYFFAPGTVGLLWIDYPARRKPVCRVRTYDASHAAKASIYDALSMKDAATAGAELSDLTLVGLAGGGPRRVNLGVVNVGDFPVTFRITVRNARGTRIGRAYLRGIREDEPFFILDAAHELEAPLDESAAVHVEMIAGTAVAYATVVDGLTGDSQFIPAVPSLRP
jgi:hypothetical protein